MNDSIVVQVTEELATLPTDLQRQVLEFVWALKTSAQHGVSGKRLLRFAGIISPDDLQLMRETIETGCEQVDLNGW
jgi:hypothetical protein